MPALFGRSRVELHVEPVVECSCIRHLAFGFIVTLIEEHRRGACGAMPACEYADLFVTIWDALEAGQIDAARDVFERVLPLLTMQASLRMAFTKAVLKRRGVIDSDRVRISGGLDLDEIDHAEIEALSARIARDLKV